MEKFVSGFCVNRFLRIIGREVFFLMDNGYMTADQIDLAVKASIIPRAMVLGFVQRYDFTGLDLSYGNLQNPDFVEAPIDNQPKSLLELVERGRVGRQERPGLLRLQRPASGSGAEGRGHDEALRVKDLPRAHLGDSCYQRSLT